MPSAEPAAPLMETDDGPAPLQRHELGTKTLVLLGVGWTLAAVWTGLLMYLDDDVHELEARGALAVGAGSVAVWLISIPAADVSLVDLWWGVAYVAQAWVFALSVPGGFSSPRPLVTLALVTVWGMRLALHLIVRKAQEGWREDPRYPERVLLLVRGEAPAVAFHLVSLLQVFVMQGTFMWLVGQSLVVLFVHGSPAADDDSCTESPSWASPCNLNVFDAVALCLWLVGFAFEAGSDLQLQRFRASPANRGLVCNGGFFKYTRHPNYFGDWLVWLGFFCAAVRPPLPPALARSTQPLLHVTVLIRELCAGAAERIVRAAVRGLADADVRAVAVRLRGDDQRRGAGSEAQAKP